MTFHNQPVKIVHRYSGQYIIHQREPEGNDDGLLSHMASLVKKGRGKRKENYREEREHVGNDHLAVVIVNMFEKRMMPHPIGDNKHKAEYHGPKKVFHFHHPLPDIGGTVALFNMWRPEFDHQQGKAMAYTASLKKAMRSTWKSCLGCFSSVYCFILFS